MLLSKAGMGQTVTSSKLSVCDFENFTLTISHTQRIYFFIDNSIDNGVTWTPGNIFYSTSSSSPFKSDQVISINASTKYRIRFNTINSQSGLTTLDPNLFITWNPLPNATVAVPSSICVGASVSIGATAVSGSTYSWSSNVGTYSSTNSNPSVSPSSTQTYTLTETITATGCNNSNNIAITVNALPVINSLMDITKVCGTKTILDAGAGYSSYLWNTGATTRYITTDITQNYSVTVTNSSSCSNIDSTYLSIVDAKLFNNDTTILPGSTVNLNAHGILNSANRAVLYDFSNANALNDFVTLTTNSGTVTITTNGQTGNGVEVIRATGCCGDAEMKTTREDFGYGTYEVDAYSASGSADQSFGIMEQSGSWLNRVLNIGTRPNGTDNQGWEVYFKGNSIASSNSSPVNNSTWYKVKVYITPTSLKVWLNSTVLFDGALPSAITNPRGAIRVGAFDISRYDNIKYTPLQELSYLWSTSETNQNITVTPTATSTYQLKVTDQTTTCNTSVDIRVLKINITNADASICNNTTQTLYIDSSFSKYANWQTKKPGIEFYNIKKDLNGNLYALPSLNSEKIYKSIDRGETWNQMAGFPSLGSNNFMALGVDQNNVIYASTNHNGIYKSIDEGVTWTQLQDFGFGCGPMDILFGNNFSILTVKGSNRGIWSSTGDLFSWQKKVGGFDPNTVTQDINGNLYAGGNSAGGKELYKSSDAGATWSKISSLYGVQIIRADGNGKVFLTEGGNNPLFVSSNQGISFTQINTLSLPNSGISYPEDILFTNNKMFITKGQVYYSKDDGVNFTQLDKITFPTAGIFNYGPGGAPSGNYGDSTNRMEMIGNRLFVASLDGIKFIDIDNLNTTVTWSTGQVGNKIEVNPISTSPGNTVTYSATVSYGAISGSDQVTFTLPTKPTITASGATTFCQGGTVTLTANSSPAGVYSYTWQTGAITQGINVASSGSYTVTAVNSNGCSETSIPTIITVNALPTISIVETDASGTTVNDNTICVGGSATLTASGGASYLWNTSETAASITKTPVTTTSYTVTGTNANGCENTATQAITVNALPTISIVETDASGTTVNDNIICVGGSATLTASGGASYLWNTSETAASITKTPITNTSYTVTGTNANGCQNTATRAITVNTLPAAPIANSASLNYNGLLQTTPDLIPPSGQSISWFTASVGGVNSSKPQGINVGTYNSYANAMINATGCISSSRTLVFLTINKAPLTITATPGQTKVYGAADPSSYAYTLSAPLFGTDALTGALTRVVGETVGPYAINQGTLTNANYDITYVGNNFTITKKSITITVDPNQTKVYGTANPLTYTYGVSPSLTGLAALTGTLTRVSGESVGSYAIEQNDLTTANNPNYTIIYVGNNFTITKRALTITATPGQTKVYGAADPSSYAYTLSAPLFGSDALSGALARAVGETVGPYAINQGTLTNTNYDITYVGNNFVITPASLSITGITGANKIYDGTTNALINGTASYIGLVLADAGLTVTGSPSFNFNDKNVGTSKPITVTGFAAPSANYILTQPTGLSGNITPKAAIINVVASNKQYDGTTAAIVNLSSPSFIASDIVTINYASATFDTKEIGTNKTVTVTGINLGSIDAPNYFLATTIATALADITAPLVFIFEVPNAFTPNGDGLNDILKIIGNAGVTELKSFKIYSRSGNLVFESRDISIGWDGTYKNNLLPSDVYYWAAVYVDRNNQTNSKTGNVLLLK
jgi:gliding motility-associated-like protein